MKSAPCCCDELVENDDQQVCISSRKNRNVDGNFTGIRLVESDTKVAFTTEKQQNEYTDVHQTNLSCYIIIIISNQSKRFYSYNRHICSEGIVNVYYL